MLTNNTLIRAGAQSATFLVAYRPIGGAFRDFRLDYTDWPKLKPGKLKNVLDEQYLKPGAAAPYTEADIDYEGFADVVGQAWLTAPMLFDPTASSDFFTDFRNGFTRIRLVNTFDVGPGLYPESSVGTVVVESMNSASAQNNTMIQVQVNYSASE